MREYFVSVTVMISLCVAFFALSFRGRRDISLKMAFGILITYAVLTPLSNFLIFDGELPKIEQPSYDFSEDYVDVCEKAFTEGVRRLISERYGLAYEDVSVAVFGFSFESMRADRISVVLSGRASLADRHAIEEYITGEGLGRCEVEIRIG